MMTELSGPGLLTRLRKISVALLCLGAWSFTAVWLTREPWSLDFVGSLGPLHTYRFAELVLVTDRDLYDYLSAVLAWAEFPVDPVWSFSPRPFGFAYISWEAGRVLAINHLWLYLLALVLTALGIWEITPLFARFRRREGYCHVCCYDLTGNTSGVCPECGHTLREPSS